MNVKLIEGHFTAKDALEIISQMIQVKIKFQEGKIERNANAEDMKMREKRIKQLQEELHSLRNSLARNDKVLELNAAVQISFPA